MFCIYPGPFTAVMIACSTVTTIATTPAPTCSEVVDTRQQLRVRIIPGATDPVVIAGVRAEVDAIWNPYQIDIVWESQRESDQQASPDLWVHFVEGTSPSARREGLIAIAWLTFHNGAPTQRIRVSRMAAAAILRTTSWDGGRQVLIDGPNRLRNDALARIVGRALAHEVGHYLLASSKHADRGLMRAVIYPKDLVSAGTSFLTLRDADVQALRAARVERCERALAMSAGKAVI